MNAHQRRVKRRREDREHEAWLDSHADYLDSIAPDCSGFGRMDLEVPCGGCQAGGMCDYAGLGHGSIYAEDPEDDDTDDDGDDWTDDFDQGADDYERDLEAVGERREARG